MNTLALMLIFVFRMEDAECKNIDYSTKKVEYVFYSGHLDEAIKKANIILACKKIKTNSKIKLHLMLSSIYDRRGLHQNTRPVAESLRQIELAQGYLEDAYPRSIAQINYSLSKYHYRAEMGERKFEKAEHYAKLSKQQFEKIEDFHGQADAVHSLGLIHFQRRNYYSEPII